MIKQATKPINEEERQDLIELLRNTGSKGILSVIEDLAKRQENEVLSLDVCDPSKERELLARKYRAEGARKLQMAFHAYIRDLLK